MATAMRPQTPVHDTLGTTPHPSDAMAVRRSHSARTASRPNSFIGNSAGYTAPHSHAGLADPSPLAQTGSASRFREELDLASVRGSAVIDNSYVPGLQRSDSQMSHAMSAPPSRSASVSRKGSLRKKASLRRSGSRRSLRAGSVRSMSLGERERYGADGAEDFNSAFYVPIPTTGSPTDVLTDRFQAWRKVLKDLIVFFKDLQKSYETRAKALLSASNVINNTTLPTTFLRSGGIRDANEILRDYHRQSVLAANKAKEIENEVILQLTGLRSDLHQKIKEIKHLHGDFKNSVDKEMEATRKSIRNLHEALGLVDTDPAATSGKGDPFIVRLHVDRQVEKQIEEENYLHRAFLNLESSGRELESIVVGEVQKAYHAYANILKHEADEAYDAIEKLQAGPLAMPKDHEWNAFVAQTEELVDPRVPLRHVENINYPGKEHPAAVEVRSGMLERKSKYLKSYTPGWYVLSPTHLHEFKSADRVAWQTPVMSLYLPEQKLGSHSQPDSASHKFMLKGRQTGAIHRGHSWVFRAESYETMMAWYEDIASLIDKTGEARNAFVRRHVRSMSGASAHTTSAASSDGGMEEDEADQTPYSAHSAVLNQEPQFPEVSRQAGGRFPSDIQLDRHLRPPMSPSSGESSGDRDVMAAAGSLPDSGVVFAPADRTVSDRESYDAGQISRSTADRPTESARNAAAAAAQRTPTEREGSYYGQWMGSGQQQLQQQQQQQQQHPMASPTREYPAAYHYEAQQQDPSVTAAAVYASPGPSHISSSHPARDDSGSTVPTTTSVAGQTNHTVPTSVDESYEPVPAVIAMRGSRPADTYKESMQSSAAVTAAATAAADPAATIATTDFVSGGVQTQPQPQGEEERIPERPGNKSQPSASTLELQIPGHYPRTGTM